jgi:hypothetical protein
MTPSFVPGVVDSRHHYQPAMRRSWERDRVDAEVVVGLSVKFEHSFVHVWISSPPGLKEF